MMLFTISTRFSLNSSDLFGTSKNSIKPTNGTRAATKEKSSYSTKTPTRKATKTPKGTVSGKNLQKTSQVSPSQTSRTYLLNCAVPKVLENPTKALLKKNPHMVLVFNMTIQPNIWKRKARRTAGLLPRRMLLGNSTPRAFPSIRKPAIKAVWSMVILIGDCGLKR